MLRGLLMVSALTAAVMAAPPAPGAEPAASRQSGADAASSPPRVMLAVLRADGIMLPFAAYNGRTWLTPWQGRIDRGVSPELPANLDAIPRGWWGGETPVSWKVWPLAAGTPQPLKLLTPAMVGVGITRQLGIRTDQPAAASVPPFELPYPKAGLAVSGDVEVKKAAIVSSMSPAFREFSASLRSEFVAAEERALRSLRSQAGWRPPFDQKLRATVVPELEAWYVSALGGGERMSYVEAVKKYPLVAADKGCGLETFVSGWVHQSADPNAKPKTTLKAVVTYCDRRDVSYMLPFGTLTLRDKVYWVFQMSGQDHEWYAVVEGSPGRAKYVAEYEAGSYPFLPR
jgi:hypothetical protein